MTCEPQASGIIVVPRLVVAHAFLDETSVMGTPLTIRSVVVEICNYLFAKDAGDIIMMLEHRKHHSDLDPKVPALVTERLGIPDLGWDLHPGLATAHVVVVLEPLWFIANDEREVTPELELDKPVGIEKLFASWTFNYDGVHLQILQSGHPTLL
jgi:hypothetical protein